MEKFKFFPNEKSVSPKKSSVVNPAEIAKRSARIILDLHFCTNFPQVGPPFPRFLGYG